MLPGLKQPLAEVRISLQRNQIILGRDRQQFTPEGQRCIDFDLRVPPFPCRRIPMRTCSFRPWEMKEAGPLFEARQKYETILAAVPEQVDALVNLGESPLPLR